MSSFLFCSLLLVLTLCEMGSAQRRSREVTAGTMRIELLGRSAVNQATIHLFLNDTLVATQSVKKDSAGDRSRLANIQNLKPGKYKLVIEAPGKKNMEKMAYVRAERSPVKMYIDFPAGRGFVGESDEAVDNEQIAQLMSTIQNLQRRVRDLERGEVQMSQIDNTITLPDSIAQNEAPQQPEMGRFQRWWRGNQSPEPEPEPEPSRRQSRRDRRNAERQSQPDSTQSTPTVEQAERNARLNSQQNIAPPPNESVNTDTNDQNRTRRGFLSRFKKSRNSESAAS